tara:strand:- start:1885 stop:2259 length:375 start_codon:yes stop_codon:yes gene_type:complete
MKKLSPKRAYHKRCAEEQKYLKKAALEIKQPKSKIVDVEICLARDGISEFMSWEAQCRWKKHINHCYLEFNNSMQSSAAKTRFFKNWRQAVKRLTKNSTYEGYHISSIRYRGKLLWESIKGITK